MLQGWVIVVTSFAYLGLLFARARALMALTRDYPYHLERAYRKALGENLVSLFGAGTCGDINHIDVTADDQPKGQAMAEHLGNSLAKPVLANLPESVAVNDIRLTVRSSLVAGAMALHAHVLLQRDVHYIVRDDRVQLINARNDVRFTYEPSLKELAAWADFLVIATVGGPSTQKLVGKEVLEALGPKGVLVNIARGSVIDEDALVSALVNGQLGGAGLDVYVSEPNVPDALKNLDNVVIVPHIASATTETRMDMVDLVLRNAESYAQTGKVITPIPAL